MKKRIPGRRKRPQPKHGRRRGRKKEKVFNLDPIISSSSDDEATTIKAKRLMNDNIHISKKERKEHVKKIEKKAEYSRMNEKKRKVEKKSKRLNNPDENRLKKNNGGFGNRNKSRGSIEEDNCVLDENIFKAEKVAFGDVVSEPPNRKKLLFRLKNKSSV